jgi:hypothetical protein
LGIECQPTRAATEHDDLCLNQVSTDKTGRPRIEKFGSSQILDPAVNVTTGT